jgi:hypothetical protein
MSDRWQRCFVEMIISEAVTEYINWTRIAVETVDSVEYQNVLTYPHHKQVAGKSHNGSLQAMFPPSCVDCWRY